MGHAFAGLHVLADDDPRWPLDPPAIARAALAGGAKVVQLRAKHAGDAAALTWAREIRALTRAAGARFVVNDRFDLALASEADAVHLGQEDLPPAAIPAAARRRLAVGRSTHEVEQVRAASQELGPGDYLAFGPVFGTTSKTSAYSDRGLERLADAVREAAPLPLVAIGGIDLERAGAVAATGAQGFAVISALAASATPEAAGRALLRAFQQGQAA